MPEPTSFVVRDTPVNLLRAGAGPALLYLHGAGAGGRWLGFQQKLAEGFDVIAPTHPGHAGAPPAEWVEHISDLAFHYLDLIDTLGLPQVHLVGASLGGWIAAEMATMASHRLASLVLIDPVGIKVEGWIYPFLFGMDLMEMVGMIFRNPVAALALAPADLSLDTIVEMYREGTAIARVSWNPYLYDPLLRRRLARITTPTLLAWGAHDRLAPLSAPKPGARRSPARRCASSTIPATCRTSSSRTRWRRRSPNSVGAGRRGDEVLRLPPDAVHSKECDEPSSWVTLSNATTTPSRATTLYHQLPRRAGVRQRSGFDGICVNEHHQTSYGTMPSPERDGRAARAAHDRARSPSSATRSRCATTRCASPRRSRCSTSSPAAASSPASSAASAPSTTPSRSNPTHRASASTRRTT